MERGSGLPPLTKMVIRILASVNDWIHVSRVLKQRKRTFGYEVKATGRHYVWRRVVMRVAEEFHVLILVVLCSVRVLSRRVVMRVAKSDVLARCPTCCFFIWWLYVLILHAERRHLLFSCSIHFDKLVLTLGKLAIVYFHAGSGVSWWLYSQKGGKESWGSCGYWRWRRVPCTTKRVMTFFHKRVLLLLFISILIPIRRLRYTVHFVLAPIALLSVSWSASYGVICIIVQAPGLFFRKHSVESIRVQNSGIVRRGDGRRNPAAWALRINMSIPVGFMLRGRALHIISFIKEEELVSPKPLAETIIGEVDSLVDLSSVFKCVVIIINLVGTII